MYVLPTLKPNSVHFTAYSPPFLGLFNYSAAQTTFQTAKPANRVWRNTNSLVKEVYRVMKPGRICAVHCTEPYERRRQSIRLSINEIEKYICGMDLNEWINYRSERAYESSHAHNGKIFDARYVDWGCYHLPQCRIMFWFSGWWKIGASNSRGGLKNISENYHYCPSIEGYWWWKWFCNTFA